MKLSNLSNDARRIVGKLGRTKRHTTVNIAAAIFGIATVGAAVGYGVSRVLRKPKPGEKAAEEKPAEPWMPPGM